MTFDEELQQAFDTLADCLRDEIAHEVRDAAAGVIARVRAQRDEAVEEAARAARAEARRQADQERQDAVSAAEARERDAADARVRDEQAKAREEIAQLEQRAQEMIEAAEASTREQMRAADLAASDRLVDAFRAIDRARSLGEILDALTSCAGREAARVGLLLARGGELRGWRFIGFGPAFDAAASIVVPIDDSGILGEAVRTRGAVSADTAGALSAPSFAALPGGRESLAVPVTMSGEAVAVLYADQGTGEPADRPSPPLTWPDTLELMARHAARCLEGVTAIKAVRVLTERPEIPLRGSSTAAASAASEPAPDEDEAARRYARLLVSEIKLYHEAAVAAGRRERDLGARLGVEIARARVLYEQRIPAEMRARGDHFHDELVRTLADGDESLLGTLRS